MSAAAEGGAAAAPATGGFDARTVATVQKLPLLSVRKERERRERGERRREGVVSEKAPSSATPPLT
jgi:hypothetical protein